MVLASFPQAARCSPLHLPLLHNDDRRRELLEFGAATNPPIVHVNLSEPYLTATKEHPLAKQMLQIAADSDDNLNAFVALECGHIVAEDYKDGFDEK